MMNTTNFETMKELQLAVVEKADALCREYISREIERGEFPPFKASGMAYIRFAKEESELFKLLYMRNREDEDCEKQLELGREIENIIVVDDYRTYIIDTAFCSIRNCFTSQFIY